MYSNNFTSFRLHSPYNMVNKSGPVHIVSNFQSELEMSHFKQKVVHIKMKQLFNDVQIIVTKS